MKKGILFVVSGPSGSGKGTVLNEVCKRCESVAIGVSATTRPLRSGEENGIDYYFLDKQTFLNYVETGEMLEYNEYCGNFYGTLRQEVERLVATHENVILEVDVNGANKISKHFDCVLIFIMPPSLQVLRSRLLSRKTESCDSLKKRLNQACVEIENAVHYDYIIVNETVEDAVDSFVSILKAEQHRSVRFKEEFSSFLKND